MTLYARGAAKRRHCGNLGKNSVKHEFLHKQYAVVKNTTGEKVGNLSQYVGLLLCQLKLDKRGC